MKTINLNNGYYTIVDDDDFEKIKHYHWYAYKRGKARNVYAVRHDTPENKRRLIFMHHMICKRKEGFVIDHIDGNSLNNTKVNLRVCLDKENAMNRKIYINNKSGYKGVYWDKTARKWRACIRVHGKLINIGYFNCLIKAAKSYNDFASSLHGKFARLNEVRHEM